MALIRKTIEIWKQIHDFNTPLLDDWGLEYSKVTASTKPGDFVLVIDDQVWVQHVDGDFGETYCRAVYDIEIFRKNEHLFERQKPEKPRTSGITERELNIKAHNYLIKNSYLILKKLHENIDHNIKEVLMDVFMDAYREGLTDLSDGFERIHDLEDEVLELGERIEELEEDVVRTEILKVENL